MADNELLQLAAKAAGKHLTRAGYVAIAGSDREDARNPDYDWNPLVDDGDALRLAVKVLNWPHGGLAFDSAVGWLYATKQLPTDPYEATRRAIVLAAAEIGRGMR